MSHFKRSQIGGVVSALLLCVASSAHAQQSATSNSSSGNEAGSSPDVVIGPPGLEDFQLEPRERLVTQPPPQRPATEPAQPAPNAQSPAQRPNEVGPAAPATSRERPQSEPVPPPSGEVVPPIVVGPEALPPPALEAPVAPAPAPSAEVDEQGGSWWPYLLLVVGLLAGAALLRRRLVSSDAPAEASLPAAAAPPAPRPQPVPRPWLEVELKAKRASFTDTEWVVQFEMSVSNTGQSVARDLRIDVMLFNAGKEQDKEIGAFFRTAGRDAAKLILPGIKPGETGIIDGEVAMPLAEMRAMKLSDRTLFIPVVGVNALYDWGEGRTGQTAKSYVVDRELQEPSEKMGAFRVDLGPRIWRTVGQRPHKLARRF